MKSFLNRCLIFFGGGDLSLLPTEEAFLVTVKRKIAGHPQHYGRCCVTIASTRPDDMGENEVFLQRHPSEVSPDRCIERMFEALRSTYTLRVEYGTAVEPFRVGIIWRHKDYGFPRAQ
jgi:hypothetical protein